MKSTALDIKDKLKWDKSSLLENNVYIKIYLEAVNSHLSMDDKHALFLVSKYFTDGAAEAGRNNLQMSNYYFEKGELLHKHIDGENEILRRIVDNVYHRSKSFYYHKTKNFQSAMTLINQTLENNIFLEKRGFEFLIYDRVQQHYNLAKVYFAVNEAEHGFNILSDSCCFLIENKCTFLTSLNEYTLKKMTPDIILLRSSLLYQFICETTFQLLKIQNEDHFVKSSGAFFLNIIRSASRFIILCPEDKYLKKWLLIMGMFYKKQYLKFEVEANSFIKGTDLPSNDRIKTITESFLKFV